MFFYLSKILLFLASPVVWIFGLFLWGMLTKKAHRKKRLLISSLVLFYTLSNAFIADEFIRAYEDHTITYSYIEEPFDAVIVLGGFSSNDPSQEQVQFHSSTDRLMAGIKLYKTGRARKLMVSSGSGEILNQDSKEAEYIKEYLLDIGIPEKDIIIESESKNTYENATFSATILNEQFEHGSYILVTSAMHMPRAKRCFTKANLDVMAFSVDHQAGPRKYAFDHLFIPNVDALGRWQGLIKEWIGFIVYKMMGYC